MNKEVNTIHFVGIAGTAMASVAAMCRDLGHRVTGSDENVYPPMSTFLEARGIGIAQGYRESNLDHHPDLIVIGNAMKRGNPEIERVLAQIDGVTGKIAAMLDDPSIKLSKVMRKRTEQAELRAYLDGLRFSLGQQQPKAKGAAT